VGERVLVMKRLVLLLGCLMICSGVLADISISEPLDIYNLGDKLYIDLDGLRGAENGNLDINLNCGNSSINLVRIPARAFSTGEDQSYSIPYKILGLEDLGILDLKSIVGTCQIIASLSGNAVSSKTFEVSDDIVVTASLDKLEYNPGENVAVKIEAVKSNGVLVNGFVEGSNVSSFNRVIEDGVAEEVFSVSETAEAGAYHLGVRVYDVGFGGVLNEGEQVVSYVVNQVAASLVLSLSDLAAVPGGNFSIGAEIFDQSGVEMNGNVFVEIISPEGEEIESVISAGEFVFVEFMSNSSVGTWKIVSQFDNLGVEREFEMLPLQKVEFDFEDSVLVVRNVGNVLYNKSIGVLIGEETMNLDLKIDVGEVRKFSLKAPVGNYEVVVGDGEHEVSRQVLLTGNAISVSDFGNGAIFKDYSIVWVFLIVVLGGIGGILLMRYRGTKTLGGNVSLLQKAKGMGKTGAELKKKVGEKVPAKVMSHMDDSLNFTKKSPEIHGLDSKDHNGEDKTMVDFTRKGAMSAEAALVLKGEKHVSGIVAMNIKNFEELSDVARDGLKRVVEGSKGKGLVDYRGDYIFVIFSPLVTRTYRNEKLSVQCGMGILESLKSYNKKFKDKIEFGIGVHAGDLIASKTSRGFKYTGIGNTISFAKRMSDVDSGKVVVSEVVRNKLIRDLKVSKGKEIGEKKTFVVLEVRDDVRDREKLKQLMARQ
jgi:class 3 adenylate cyclase